jgi:hypothetical protein
MTQYKPQPFQSSNLSPEVADYLAKEFNKIAASFYGINNILLPELNVAPEKPREGMVVLADGTNWNPGSGAGFYGYYSGAWNKLG